MGQVLIGFLIVVAIPTYFVLQPLTLLRWEGPWRLAAAAPLALSVPAAVFSAYALTQDSNLWPITLIFAALIGSVWLVALWGVRSLL